MKIKLNDQVAIIAGKDKGKKGKVMKVLRKHRAIIVEKVNIKVKHVKKTQEKSGEKIEFEGKIDVSNVMIICPNCGKRTRVGYKILESKKKQRICKKCKEAVDKVAPKKA
ncbi:MAG: 50S ribosomal protein L24 [bacterium]|nr:50S ribosomal protein L24 [bacterium]